MKILKYSIKDGFIDILVDISQFMHENENKCSLLICISLLKTLTQFGVKIRISVFGESEKVWILSEFIDNQNIDILILRLRDAFCSQKRFISYSADALYKIKNNFYSKEENKNKKYIQILISNLISPQIFNKENNCW